MALSQLLKEGRLRLLPGRRRASPRQARQAARIVPAIGCIPGSEVWFFRFAIAFLAHLGQGGQIVDRLSGRIVGDPIELAERSAVGDADIGRGRERFRGQGLGHHRPEHASRALARLPSSSRGEQRPTAQRWW